MSILNEVAIKIWNICRLSPEHGNAVMDVIGNESYNKVMELQKDDKSITVCKCDKCDNMFNPRTVCNTFVRVSGETKKLYSGLNLCRSCTMDYSQMVSEWLINGKNLNQ